MISLPDIDQVVSQSLGAHCGLNADWSVTAWRLSPGRTNIDPGQYLLDLEDGIWAVVRRDGDEVTVLREMSESEVLAILPSGRSGFLVSTP